jgi:hypothetical protein
MPHVRATAANPVVNLDNGVTVTPNSSINVDTTLPLAKAALEAKPPTIEALDAVAAPKFIPPIAPEGAGSATL